MLESFLRWLFNQPKRKRLIVDETWLSGREWLQRDAMRRWLDFETDRSMRIWELQRQLSQKSTEAHLFAFDQDRLEILVTEIEELKRRLQIEEQDDSR